MNKSIVLLALILLLGLVLRLHHYRSYPPRGATSDEYAFAFAGISLLTKHTPIAWSAIQLYKDKKEITIDGINFPIVKPYLDHPPFFSLLIGSWALLNGQDTFEKITLTVIRIVPILLSLITCVFVFLLSRQIYGYRSALWAMLLFATIPLSVVNARAVLAENLLSVLFLAGLYVVSLPNKISFKKIILLSCITGAAFLSKVLGIVVFLSILYFLLQRKTKRKYIILYSAIFAFFCSLFIIYGLYFGGNLFWQIQSFQGERAIGPLTLFTIFSSPIIINRVFYDSWYFLGLFSILFLSFDYEKHKLIVIPFFIYVLLLVLSVTQNDFHGWYLIPLIPFLSIASARVLIEAVKKKSFLLVIFFLFVSMMVIRLGENFYKIDTHLFRFLVLLPFVVLIFTRKILTKYLISYMFYFLIAINIIVSFFYVHPA